VRAILACVQATASAQPRQVSPKQLAEDLLGLWHYLLRGNTQWIYDLVDELDLTLTQMKTLHALAECGCELTVKQLGDRLALSLPGTSRTVDALLRRGWLERREDEHDRRMKRVRLTAEGVRVVERIDSARLHGLEQYTASLTPEQRSRLAAALADLPHRS
jgi:DNA-binding MarR family transcriptional regulator